MPKRKARRKARRKKGTALPPETLPKSPDDEWGSSWIFDSEGYDAIECHVYISSADFLGPGCRRFSPKAKHY